MSATSLPAPSSTDYDLIDQATLDSLKRLGACLYDAQLRVENGELASIDDKRFRSGVEEAMASVSVAIGTALQQYRKYFITLMFAGKTCDVNDPEDYRNYTFVEYLLKYVLEPPATSKSPESIEDYPWTWTPEEASKLQARFDALVTDHPVYVDLFNTTAKEPYIGEWY